MPRQKKVAEVPVETINAINGSLTGAQMALNEMSYAQVQSLSPEAMKHIDSAVVEVNRAVAHFQKTYINRPKQPTPTPRRTTKIKKVLQSVAEE